MTHSFYENNSTYNFQFGIKVLNDLLFHVYVFFFKVCKAIGIKSFIIKKIKFLPINFNFFFGTISDQRSTKMEGKLLDCN